MQKINCILVQYDARCLMFTNLTTDLRSLIGRKILRDGTHIIIDNIHRIIEIQINSDKLEIRN